MSPEDEAAEAERAEGRKLLSYQVVGRSLTHNGVTIKPDGRVRFSRADGEILMAAGRIKPAKGKPEASEEE